MKNVYEIPAVEVMYLDALDVLAYSYQDTLEPGVEVGGNEYAGGRNPIIWG